MKLAVFSAVVALLLLGVANVDAARSSLCQPGDGLSDTDPCCNLKGRYNEAKIYWNDVGTICPASCPHCMTKNPLDTVEAARQQKAYDEFTCVLTVNECFDGYIANKPGDGVEFVNRTIYEQSLDVGGCTLATECTSGAASLNIVWSVMLMSFVAFIGSTLL